MAGIETIRTEIRTYFRELPRLLEEGHEGRAALIKGDAIIGLWDTPADAYQAGRERFGLDQAFLAQPIDSRDLAGNQRSNLVLREHPGLAPGGKHAASHGEPPDRLDGQGEDERKPTWLY